MLRYRFNAFTLSPQRRLLLKDGREVALIPKYFDLLLLLIERRREAVHRREIFERVWTDVIVSESALSQAVRSIRSVLGDDSREPRFIRTVSRHGYQFVFPDVIEEQDDGRWPPVPVSAVDATDATDVTDATDATDATDSTDATGAVDSRDPIESSADDNDASVKDRASQWRRAARLAATRWGSASAGAAIAGIAAGACGGAMLAIAPGSSAPTAFALVLAVIGGAAGALGGAGVGAGLALAESLARSRRGLALLAGGSIGGGLVGLAVQVLMRSGLAALVGVRLDVGGGVEGLVIGAAAGLGFAIATRSTDEGLAAPRGRQRLQAALITAACCGFAALSLTLTGHALVSGTINAIGHAAHGSSATLAPLGRMIGEPDFGPVSAAIFATIEGALFGLGLSYGLMRRPRDRRSPESHESLNRA